MHVEKNVFSALVRLGYCSQQSILKFIETGKQLPTNVVNYLIPISEGQTQESCAFAQSLSALKSIGIEDSKLLKLLTSRNAGSILISTPVQVVAAANGLSALGFDETTRADLIVKCPEIVQILPNDVVDTYAWLRQTFTRRRARHMVILRPHVLTVGQDVLIGRAHYMFGRMRVTAREIAQYGAIGHSLEKIRIRHVFLLRCGRYEFPDAKARVRRLGKNPSLKDILDTSVEVFVKKVARLTIPEYVLFKKLFVLEIESEEEEEY